MKTIDEIGPVDQDHIRRLKALSDDDIDCSEIPPLTQEQLRYMRRSERQQTAQPTVTITLHIAPDIYQWYRSHSSDYEASMNDALRREMAMA
jgi:uncharacterized protein (DUF4415 family)